MRVDQLSTYARGGAGLAALRLHRALNETEVHSRLWYAKGEPAYPLAGVERLESRSSMTRVWRKLWQKLKLKRATAGRPPGAELFTMPIAPDLSTLPLEQWQTDILHVHWIAKSIDQPSLFRSLPPGLPVVWSLHDMNPITGGCHYSGDCTAFIRGCSHCPQLARPGSRDLSQESFGIKQAAIAGLNLHVVTPSHWLTSEAQRSAMFRSARSIQTIHHGIDVELYQPIEKAAARRRLGLRAGDRDGPERVVIAFGAESLKNQRKGFQHLLEALRRLDQSTIGLAFGGGDLPAHAGRSEIRSLGYLNDPAEQVTVYSAADIFVIPSLEEAFGLTALEAMACGTPVVGFNAGGIPDMVREGQTGRLAQVGDVNDLVNKIQWLVQHQDARQVMGHNARSTVLEHFNEPLQAQKYVELYQSLVARRPVGVAA